MITVRLTVGTVALLGAASGDGQVRLQVKGACCRESILVFALIQLHRR